MRGAYGDGLVPANPRPAQPVRGDDRKSCRLRIEVRPNRAAGQVSVKRQLTLTLQVTGHDMVLGFTGWQDRQGGETCADLSHR